MRKLFLVTGTAAALAAFAGIATAQTTQGPTTGPGAGAAAKSENTRPAESQGALSGALKGDTTGSTNPGSAGSEDTKPMHGTSSGEKTQ